VKVAREGTLLGGAVVVWCLINFGAAAFEAAPASEVPPPSSSSNLLLPEFLDSSRLPEMQDAWRSSVTREGSSNAETTGATSGREQPVRRRAEELSGRFIEGESSGSPAAKGAEKPSTVRELPTSLSEAAMPGGNSVMSHMGAPVKIPPDTDETTTATLPDLATEKPAATDPAPQPSPSAAGNATWLKVGLPPLPVRSPKTAKAHAKVKAKAKVEKAKSADKAEETVEKKPSGSKSTAGKVATAKSAETDDDDKPVRQFRTPVVTHAAPAQPRQDPGRKEVFPPYLGAYGLTSQAR
jgi:hypothetical protein